MVDKTDTNFGIWNFSYGYFGYDRIIPLDSTLVFNLIFGSLSFDKLSGGISTDSDLIFGTTVYNKF